MNDLNTFQGIQYVAKNIGACKKKIPIIINQNHIFSKYYCEVISGLILTNITPKHSELSIFWLFILQQIKIDFDFPIYFN